MFIDKYKECQRSSCSKNDNSYIIQKKFTIFLRSLIYVIKITR